MLRWGYELLWIFSYVLQYSIKVYKQCLMHQVSSYAIRDAEEYRNFCDRPKDQRPLPEEVIGVSLLRVFESVEIAGYNNVI